MGFFHQHRAQQRRVGGEGEFVLDKDSGGVVAKLKVLSEVNSCDNLRLLGFWSPERQSLTRLTKEDQEMKDINKSKT